MSPRERQLLAYVLRALEQRLGRLLSVDERKAVSELIVLLERKVGK